MLIKISAVLCICLTTGCTVIPQAPEAQHELFMPEPLKYIESENTIYNINYTCFKLAEKTKIAFDAYRGDKLVLGHNLFIGTINCTSELSGRYAFVSLSFSTDENDSSQIMTGPTIFATTSDGAKTFKWSTWEMGY